MGSPAAQADIQFTFPVSSEEEEELRLILNWRAANMFDFAADSDSTDDTNTYVSPTGLAMPEVEVLMYALPHHQERIRPAPGSTNAVQNIGCQAIIHGIACPVRCFVFVIVVSAGVPERYMVSLPPRS
jgi:hypothetical protein